MLKVFTVSPRLMMDLINNYAHEKKGFENEKHQTTQQHHRSSTNTDLLELITQKNVIKK